MCLSAAHRCVSGTVIVPPSRKDKHISLITWSTDVQVSVVLESCEEFGLFRGLYLGFRGKKAPISQNCTVLTSSLSCLLCCFSGAYFKTQGCLKGVILTLISVHSEPQFLLNDISTTFRQFNQYFRAWILPKSQHPQPNL